MEYFKNKVDYLRDYCKENGFSDDTKEGKVFMAFADVLDDMSELLDGILEQFGNDEENEDATYEYAFICPECGEEIEVSEEVFEEEEEICCPKCGNMIPVCATDFSDEDFE